MTAVSTSQVPQPTKVIRDSVRDGCRSPVLANTCSKNCAATVWSTDPPDANATAGIFSANRALNCVWKLMNTCNYKYWSTANLLHAGVACHFDVFVLFRWRRCCIALVSFITINDAPTSPDDVTIRHCNGIVQHVQLDGEFRWFSVERCRIAPTVVRPVFIPLYGLGMEMERRQWIRSVEDVVDGRRLPRGMRYRWLRLVSDCHLECSVNAQRQALRLKEKAVVQLVRGEGFSNPTADGMLSCPLVVVLRYQRTHVSRIQWNSAYLSHYSTWNSIT